MPIGDQMAIVADLLRCENCPRRRKEAVMKLVRPVLLVFNLVALQRSISALAERTSPEAALPSASFARFLLDASGR
jgi:hypothetical protein